MADLDTTSVPGVSQLSQMAHRGLSSVYRGYQDRFDRRVAVKVLFVDSAEGMDAAARRRFERECAVTGRLSNHPHVVGVHDCGVLDDGRPYLVTELCERGSLADRLAESGPLGAAEVVDIGLKISAALEEAHRAGIIHRDVKPANILLRSSGGPALADFGLSIRTGGDASRGLDAFSPAYAPPEALAEGRHLAAGDIYSLGSTLHTLLTGRPPVPFDAGEAPLAYIRRVLDAPVARIDHGQAPPELSEAVLAMLSRQPEDRPSAKQVIGLLQRVRDLGGSSTADLLPSPPPSLDDTSERRDLASETQVRPAAATERKGGFGLPRVGPRLARRVALVVAVVVVAVAVAGGALAYGPSLLGTGVGPGDAPPSAPPSAPPTATGPAEPDRPTPSPGAPAGPTQGSQVPGGYHAAEGREGLTVAVPDGWEVAPTSSPHTLKAADPHDPERFVLFSGEPAEDRSQRERVDALAAQLPDYRPLALRQVRYGDAEDAVDWEVRFTLDGREIQAHGRYWRIQGREYAVYSRAPVEDRQDMEATFDVMAATARPR